MPKIAILSHAFEGTTSAGCEVCTLPFSHAAHRHGGPGEEVSVGAHAPTPRPDALRDAYSMLVQADRDLTGLRPETAQQTLQDALRVLRNELGARIAPTAVDLAAYRESVRQQSARIDAALNEEGRKTRKRR